MDIKDCEMMMTPESLSSNSFRGVSPPAFSLDQVSAVSNNSDNQRHRLLNQDHEASDPNATAGMRKMVYLGYRADCSKCIAREVGHYSHIVYLSEK